MDLISLLNKFVRHFISVQRPKKISRVRLKEKIEKEGNLPAKTLYHKLINTHFRRGLILLKRSLKSQG